MSALRPKYANIKTRMALKKPLHPGHQIPLERLHYQMKIIPHEAIGMDLPIGFRARLRQRGDEQLPILVSEKDRFPPVAAIHHVVNCARILNL